MDAGGRDGAPAAPLTPAAKCQNLLVALCTKVIACGADLSVSECLSGLTTDCSKVKAVSASYDACMRDIPAADCPLETPNSCSGVLDNS